MTLWDDIQAILERDPAATSVLEVVLTYPGLHALILHRLAHRLSQANVPLVPRLISHLNRFVTGIEIHPSARIGRGCFIDHGMGLVIGETSEVGDGVTLHQGVTLGGTGKEKGKRHPTLGNYVMVGVGSKILGAVTVGDYARIGAGAVVLKDVPAHSTAVGVPAKVVTYRAPDGSNLRVEQLPDPELDMISELGRQIDHLRDRVELLEGLLRDRLADSREPVDPMPPSAETAASLEANGNGFGLGKRRPSRSKGGQL
jgi:serine O-acetyltransferase